MSLANRSISVFNWTMFRRNESEVDDPDVSAEIADLHHKYAVVPADKASKNIVFVCKTHYMHYLMEELGMA